MKTSLDTLFNRWDKKMRAARNARNRIEKYILNMPRENLERWCQDKNYNIDDFHDHNAIDHWMENWLI